MAYRPFNINIPETENGQVVSANLMMQPFGRYMAALLSEAQAEYSACKMKGNITGATTTYATGQTMYLVHSKNALFYVIAMKTTGGTGYCRLIDADDSTVYLELSTTVIGSWDVKSGTVSAAFSAKSAGDLVTINVQTKVSSASYTVTVKVIAIGQQGVISTWSSYPAFANGTPSSADDLNAVRSNLMRLENSKIANMNTLLASAPIVTITPTDTWVDVMDAAIRYRPEDLYAYIERKGGGGTGINWRVILYNASAPDTEVATYTKGATGSPADYAWSASAIPWDGYGFTLGDWVRLRVQALDDGGAATGYVRRVCLFRSSDLVADGAWGVARTWAEGDTEMSEAELGKMTANMALLYTGGVHELWGQSVATLNSPDATEGDAEDRAFTGIHRKRWLCCKAHSDSETPAILYGQGLAEGITLPYDGDLDWQIYDMDEYDVPYGSVMIVTGADVAFESTIIPVEA